jgi:hypothetical protein
MCYVQTWSHALTLPAQDLAAVWVVLCTNKRAIQLLWNEEMAYFPTSHQFVSRLLYSTNRDFMSV